MNRVERITRSLRARRRRKTIRKINEGVFNRYRRKKKALRKKYQKIKGRQLTNNL
jgi:hypothetical protein